MPAQLKKRTTTGATNVKKAQSKTNINLCVCKTCTCGRHGCAGGDHTSFSVTDKKSGISSETESRAQYHQHPPQEHKLVKLKVELPPERQLEGTSETQTQFIERPLPERQPPRVVAAYHNPEPLADLSEQHEKFKAWPSQGRPSKFKQVVLKQNDALLEGVSETKTQFIERPLPMKAPPRENKYVANPAPIEGESVSHVSYQPWPVQGRPVKFKKVDYKPNPDQLETNTTMRLDYKGVKAERAKPIKKPEEYIAPTGGIDTSSLYKEEFKKYDHITVPVKHIREMPTFAAEDRDFGSTISTSFAAPPASFLHRPVKHLQKYVPNNNQLEGESVLHSDYKGCDAAAIRAAHVGHDIKKAALTDRQGTFHISGKQDNIEDQSVYKAEFQKKALPNAVRHFVGESKKNANAAGSTRPLEGESVQHSDYVSPANKSKLGVHVYDKVPNFKPAEAKYADHEDRDFNTESKVEFQTKVCDCPVLASKDKQKSKAADGHIYFAKSEEKNSAVAA